MTLDENFSRFTTSNTTSSVHPVTKDRFSRSLNVLLNYWEIKPSQYEVKLQELALHGVQDIATFIPWAHVETDIHHSLKKFLKIAAQLKFHVRVLVMPELGISYPNAGVPKDLLAKNANLAVDRNWRVIYNHAAPNIFPLPSFSSPEVLKRFGNYLIKIGATLGEVFSESGGQFCEIVVSNSFFNYYGGYGQKLSEHGDYSASHVLAFREFLDREYKPGESGDNEQFKTQLYESYNRHRYFAHVEKLLREKTDLVFNRKGVLCSIRHIDLFNPECAPEASYQFLLSELLNFKPSVESYYEKIVAGGYRGEIIHLGNTGVFRKFSDQQKSFLVLASLIHSGELSLDSEELFKLSRNFHRKIRSLLSVLTGKGFQKQSKITYVSASKYSMEERSFHYLSSMSPGQVRAVAGLGTHMKSLSERLVFMDPKSVMRVYELVQLFNIAQSGKVVAIPSPMSLVANYTADAIAQLNKFRKGKNPLRTNFGVPCEIYDYQLGQVVFYDPQSFWLQSEDKSDQALFFKSLLGLAEVSATFSVSDARVHVSCYVPSDDAGKTERALINEKLLFLINPTDEEIHLKIGFPTPVILSSPEQSVIEPEEGPITGRSFEVVVPKLGIFSMRVADPGTTDLNKSGADLTSEGRLWT